MIIVFFIECIYEGHPLSTVTTLIKRMIYKIRFQKLFVIHVIIIQNFKEIMHRLLKKGLCHTNPFQTLRSSLKSYFDVNGIACFLLFQKSMIAVFCSKQQEHILGHTIALNCRRKCNLFKSKK